METRQLYAPAGPSPPRPSAAALRPGDELDGFTLIRLLGEGGMGRVFLAYQHRPPRSVAIKFLRPDPALAGRERFAIEAEALARLSHPGIAALYGIGRYPREDGDPYLVLEYVEGAPLRDWARPRRVAEKVALLAEICEAVEHAHQRGVIHRDLKPENILVTEEGRPKILDFGIARLAGTGLPANSGRLTAAGFVVGTLSYMSPEQTVSDRDEVDTRSDIYALGLIGYELLVGRLPYELPRDTHDAIETIRRAEATPLGRHDRRLRGDLEAIFAMALAKDKERRYPSALAFAEDLRSYLAHRPIRARRPGVGHRLAKFARRNPALSASLLALTALALGSVAAILALARGEQLARRAAEREAERAGASLAMLEQVLTAASPFVSGSSDQPIGAVLGQAAARLRADTVTDPMTRLDLWLLLARVHTSRGDWREAEGAVGEAERLAAEADASRRLRLQAVAAILDWVRDASRAAGERIEALLPALAAERSAGPLLFEAGLAVARFQADNGRVDAARTVIERLEPVASDALARGRLEHMRAELAFREGRVREALAILERAMALPLPEGPGSTLLRLRWRADQALLLETLGERDAARASYREALAGLLPALGTAHPLVTSLRLNYASFLLDEGRLEDAESELSALDGALPPENPDRIAVAERLATIASERGLHEEAVTRSRAAVARAERIYGPAHEETVSALLNLATRLERLPALEEAWRVLERASERARAAYPEDHPLRFRVDRERAAALRVRGRFAEAEAELKALGTRARARLGPQSPEALAIDSELLELRFESGERETLLAALDEALPRTEAVFGPGHARVFRLRLIAALAALRRDPERALSDLERLWRESVAGGLSRRARQLAVSAAAELTALGRPEAARWASRASSPGTEP